MRLEALTPMLRTWDLPGSVAFFTEVLGFKCDSSSDDWSWASLRRDDVKIMLAGPNRHENDIASGFTGSLYFRTDNVDALWQLLKDKTRVCYTIEDFTYGMREFAIYDNNGYVLQFGQPIPAQP